MLLKQMRYFVAVVDCNSFTEAAAQCYISQSAISQQIQALEKELGAELLRRENRRFSLTPAGAYFYGRGKKILEDIEGLCRETARMGQGRRPLRVGYLRCYSGMELQQAVAEFSRLHPESSVDIMSGTHEELYSLLRSDGVDLCLNDQRRAFSDAYVNLPLLQSGCCAELSALNPLSGGAYVTVEGLRQLPCILIAPRGQREAEQEYYQNTLGLGGSFLFADSLEEGRLMVAGNRGFLPVERVGTLPPPGDRIRRLPIYRQEKQLLRSYCAFWRKDKNDSRIEAFARILRDRLQPEG